jgi:hypothetical protein
MCLLCEELWMPFELPPEAKPRTFVADSPDAGSSEPASPPTPDPSPIGGLRPPLNNADAKSVGYGFAREEGNLEAGESSNDQTRSSR